MSLFPSFLLGDRVTARLLPLTRLAAAMTLLASVSGCSVLAVADAAVTVAATAVSVTATVVETTVDVTAAGVRAVTSDDKDPQDAQEPEAQAEDDAKLADQRQDTAQNAAQNAAVPRARPWQPPQWPVNH